MPENKYDDPRFFEKYSQMDRSVHGLEGAGEWPALQKLLPDFSGKRVLDLGCGFGWHCRYAVQQGASSVTGVDLSQSMLDRAAQMTDSPRIQYRQMAIEEADFLPDSFDIVLSSLALHYVASFREICRKVYGCLTAGGSFVFSTEHPVFTAQGPQSWHCDSEGNRLHWPVDRYFLEGERTAVFLGEEMTKYHRTVTTFVTDLLETGFVLTGLCEPQPLPELVEKVPEMRDELRRPMMLILAARK